jgi:hypothetical protein
MSRKKSGKPTSQARIRANRANALKSTGPNTEEGKARSRMNAWKHGITARGAALSKENPEAFERLALGYRSRYQPADAFEVDLLDQIIIVHWHMDRLRYIQSAHLELELNRDSLATGFLPDSLSNDFLIALAYQHLADHSRIIDLTNRELARLSREYARLNQVFLDIRRECPVVDPGDCPARPQVETAPSTLPASSPATPSQMPVQNEPIAARLLIAPIQLKPKEISADSTPPLAARAAA